MMPRDNEPPNASFRVLDFMQQCPDCGVAVGEPHDYDEYNGGCDIARCLVTGLQRLSAKSSTTAAETSGPGGGRASSSLSSQRVENLDSRLSQNSGQLRTKQRRQHLKMLVGRGDPPSLLAEFIGR